MSPGRLLATVLGAALSASAEPCRSPGPEVPFVPEMGPLVHAAPRCGGAEDRLCAALKRSLLEGLAPPGAKLIGEACAESPDAASFWRDASNKVEVALKGHCGTAASADAVKEGLADLAGTLGLSRAESSSALERLLKATRPDPPEETEAEVKRLERALSALESALPAAKAGEFRPLAAEAWTAVEPRARRLFACAAGDAAEAFKRRFLALAPYFSVLEHVREVSRGDAAKARDLVQRLFAGDGLSEEGLALAERLERAAGYRLEKERAAAPTGAVGRERRLPKDIPPYLYKAAPHYVEFLLAVTGPDKREFGRLEQRMLLAQRRLEARLAASSDWRTRTPEEHAAARASVRALLAGSGDPALERLVSASLDESLQAQGDRAFAAADGAAEWVLPCYEAAREALRGTHDYGWEMGLGCIPGGPLTKGLVKGGATVFKGGKAVVLAAVPAAVPKAGDAALTFTQYVSNKGYVGSLVAHGDAAARFVGKFSGVSEREGARIVRALGTQGTAPTCARHAITGVARAQGRRTRLFYVKWLANAVIQKARGPKGACVNNAVPFDPAKEGMTQAEMRAVMEKVGFDVRKLEAPGGETLFSAVHHGRELTEAAYQAALKGNAKTLDAVIGELDKGRHVVALVRFGDEGYHAVAVLGAGMDPYGRRIFMLYDSHRNVPTWIHYHSLFLTSALSVSAPPSADLRPFFIAAGLAVHGLVADSMIED